MKNPRTNKQTKPERKKIESIPVVPQSTKMTKKRNMDKNKTNKLLLNVRLLLFESKKMSFPVAHLYKQFFGQANTEIQCTTLQSNMKEKTSL